MSKLTRWPDREERDNEILRRSKQGESAGSIARNMGIHIHTALSTLNRHGVATARRSRKALPLAPEEITERHAQGTTVKELAALCGSSEMTIRRRLEDQGAMPRGPQERLDPRWSPKGGSEEDIVSGYQRGTSTADLAQTYEVPVRTIRKILKRNGVDLHGATKGRSDLPAAEVIQAYQSGNSLAETAKLFGVSSGTIVAILKENGIERRPQSGPATRSLTAEQSQEALRRYQEGTSARVVGEAFGVSRTVIERIARDAGVLRTRGRQ